MSPDISPNAQACARGVVESLVDGLHRIGIKGPIAERLITATTELIAADIQLVVNHAILKDRQEQHQQRLEREFSTKLV